jgi:hypothetical protein
MKIERQLQGNLNTVLTEIIRERNIENKIQPYVTNEENRADITLKNKSGKPIFFIELKDPTAKNGRSVFDSETVLRELGRAQKTDIRYFGICNFLACAFFDSININEKVSIAEGFFTVQEIVRLSNSYVVSKDIEKKLRTIAEFYIDRALEIVERKAVTFSQPDELYIFKIRKLIEVYSFDITDKVWDKYNIDKKFVKDIQGYTQSQLWNVPKTYEEIENLTHIALLMLISKLIFYKAYVDNQTWHNLSPMKVGNDIETAPALENLIWHYFTEFKEVTGDFELLIGERADIIFQIPFVSDAVVELVKDLLDTDKYYDFSKIPYDIIGRIFEELIRPDERHKLGQYFTPPHVIDLILAFAINNENDRVFDPSCGSGTFLVRAYERKKKLSLNGGKSTKRHENLLNEIYGNDLSGYPAYLSMLNLSIRNTRHKSYPRIINHDFFAIGDNTKVEIHNQDGETERKPLPTFHAVIGNPPYTRQEDIGAMHGTIKKEHIQKLIKAECSFNPSQRTSIYAYFFYHASAFLKDNGYLAYIVQNSWLDTDYGIDLQQFFLRTFEIIAIMDSETERFFPTASVNTTIVILRKQKDEDARNRNIVKFVYFKDTLHKALKHYGNADKLKAFIENASGNLTGEYAKINCMRQSELAAHNKWGQFLKAPQVYLDIWEKGKDRFKNLAGINSIAKIQRGITSGCNEFFFGEDITNESNKKILNACVNNFDNYESIEDIKKNGLRIFKNGINECFLIEKKILQKALKLTRDIDNYIINKVNPAEVIFYVNFQDKFKKSDGFDLNGYRKFLQKKFPYSYSYILHGEKTEIKGSLVSEKGTCASRQAWWDLGSQGEKDFISLRFRDKRNWFPIVESDFLLGDVVFYGVFNDAERKALYSISLNSSFTILQTELFGRVNLGDGLLTTYGPDLEALQVLDISTDDNLQNEINATYNLIKGVEVISIFKELGVEDGNKLSLTNISKHRLQLDELFLKLIGYTDKSERDKILYELYSSLIYLINSRLQKAQSLKTVKTERNKTEITVYTEQLKHLVEENKLKPENNLVFAQRIQKLLPQITSETALQKKILASYWKELYNEPFDEKAIAAKAQNKLFG